MNWVLILFIYAGAFSKGDSVALTSINDFPSQAICEAAGKKSVELVGGTIKDAKYICIRKQ